MARDIWHMLDGSYGAQVSNEEQLKQKSMWDMCHNLRGWKSKDMDKRIREIQENQWRGDMWQIGHPT